MNKRFTLRIGALAAICLLGGACTTSPTAPAPSDDVVVLFDGRTLGNWAPTDFGGQQGEVRIQDGAMILERGDDLTGVTWTGEPPARMNYEISLQARRVVGNDFFCGLTFPVGQSYCSLIVGGWSGTVVGISSLDYMDAANNETTRMIAFVRNQWYDIRVRITEGRLQAWIDDKPVVDTATADRRISVRPEAAPCEPLGVATWRTQGEVRGIRLRRLDPAGL